MRSPQCLELVAGVGERSLQGMLYGVTLLILGIDQAIGVKGDQRAGHQSEPGGLVPRVVLDAQRYPGGDLRAAVGAIRRADDRGGCVLL